MAAFLMFDSITEYKEYNRTFKMQILRNCVRPELGLHILNESKRDIQPDLFR